MQAPDARLTALDAQGTSAVLRIGRNSVSNDATPLIRVANLHPQRQRAEARRWAVPQQLRHVEVDNVIVHGHRAPDSQFIRAWRHAGLIQPRYPPAQCAGLRQQRQLPGAFPLASVLFTSLSLNSNRNWYASNNTIVAGRSGAEALRMQSDGNFWVINNILRGGVAYTSSITGAGAATDPQVRQLFNNFASTPTTDRATILTNQGNSGRPAARPRDPRPAAKLTAGQRGTRRPPGGVPDVDSFGQPRVFGTFIDVGAVELQQAQVLPDPVFASGFEPPL